MKQDIKSRTVFFWYRRFTRAHGLLAIGEKRLPELIYPESESFLLQSYFCFFITAACLVFDGYVLRTYGDGCFSRVGLTRVGAVHSGTNRTIGDDCDDFQ